MKKILFYSLSIALCTIPVTSCKKTTKGEIVNEWSVKSYRKTTKYGTYALSDTPSKPNKLTIKKNGTWVWEWKISSNAVMYGGSVSVSSGSTLTNEGTWRLEKAGGKEYKYLILNTLSEKDHTITTFFPNMTGLFEDYDGTTSKTYAEGEKTIKYSILESTNKILKLEAEGLELNPTDSTTILTKFELDLEED